MKGRPTHEGCDALATPMMISSPALAGGNTKTQNLAEAIKAGGGGWPGHCRLRQAANKATLAVTTALVTGSWQRRSSSFRPER
jgi:hypothetical protein